MTCNHTLITGGGQVIQLTVDECPTCLRAQVAALTATLDGDPHQTATPEQRRAWRASAIKYADRLEAEVARLTAALKAAEAAESQVAALQTALAAANEDAERMASESAFYEEGTGWRCIHCGENTKRNGYAVKHAADCPITLHRARVGGV